MHKIITDNTSIYRAAVVWLEKEYGIKRIRISSYNFKANRRIQRPHWDVQQMIWKATGSNPTKMVLVLLSCVMGRQDYHKEELWLFTVLYDYRSASYLWISRKRHG